MCQRKGVHKNMTFLLLKILDFFIHTLLEIYDYILKCLFEHENSLLKKDIFLLIGFNSGYNAFSAPCAIASIILFLILFL